MRDWRNPYTSINMSFRMNVIGKISVEPTIAVGPKEMNFADIEGTKTSTAAKTPVKIGSRRPGDRDVVTFSMSGLGCKEGCIDRTFQMGCFRRDQRAGGCRSIMIEGQ